MAYTLTCVCAATRIEVDALPDYLAACNCAYCSKKGALWGYYPPSRVRIVADAAPGRWRPNTNEHHFCSRCGSTTYSLTPNWQHDAQGPYAEGMQIALNMRLLDDADLGGIWVEQIDGRKGWA